MLTSIDKYKVESGSSSPGGPGVLILNNFKVVLMNEEGFTEFISYLFNILILNLDTVLGESPMKDQKYLKAHPYK